MDNIHNTITAIASKHGLTAKDLLSKGRFAHITRARNEAIFDVLNIFRMRFSEVGRIFNMSHSSIMRCYGQHQYELGINTKWSRAYHRNLKERYGKE